MRFESCEHCECHLTPGHIVQTMNIPQSSIYVAVILKCPMCRENTKRVMERMDLEEAQAVYDDHISRFKEELVTAHGEVLDVDSVAHLQEIWSRTPPRIEELRGKCSCRDCMEKWYVW